MTHLSLSLRVDFAARQIEGTAALELAVAEGAEELVLDTRRLTIRAVLDAEGRPLPYDLAEDDPVLGAALRVRLEPGAARVARVVVSYATAPDAPALEWLDPDQTAGGKHPFLFTQGHAIQARSWIPIQDSPGIRLTYDAVITVGAPLVARMGAECSEWDAPAGTFAFRMSEPVPAYLIALAVGDLATRPIGPRTAVWAEPALIDAAAYEFGELERMLEAAEGLLGPYPWGRFDVLVMPPSFPYGGMENPRLTFVSPTLLAGDRSLVTVVAHELAHAWAGNLVVNATWNDFWLNEGTTVYVELRLNELLWGKPCADLLRSSCHRDLAAHITRVGQAAPDTRLRYDMTGRDPSEGVTLVPYLKGAAFFFALERAVGRESFDAWLRGWFTRHAFGSVTTDMLLQDLREHLGSPGGEAWRAVDFARWVDEPGLLEDAAPPPSAMLQQVDDAAAALRAGGGVEALDPDGWSPQAWRHFLNVLLEAPPSEAVLSALDDRFHLSSSHNAEVLLPWLRIELRARFDIAAARVERSLSTHGRYKYLRPLYMDLLATERGAELARRTYAGQRARYHHLVRTGLDALFASHAKPT